MSEENKCVHDSGKHLWLPIALGKMCQRCNLYISKTGLKMAFKDLKEDRYQ